VVSRLHSLWRNIVHRARVDRDLDDEIRATVDLLVDENVRVGMPVQEARRAARIALGSPESMASQVRDIRAGAFCDVLYQDARHGARLLLRNPLFALTAIFSLAICIGANTAVFTVANRLLFRDPSGVPDPDRLVDIAPTRADGRFAEPVLSYRMYADIRDRVTTLDGVYGYQLDAGAMSLRGPAGAERIFSTFVTSNYFAVLRIQAALGRLFGRLDSDRPDSTPVVILSYPFWTRRFNADPAVVGRTLYINGQPLTVIGVTPADFQGLSIVTADVWLPVSLAAMLTREETAWMRLAVGGRVRPDVSFSQAAAEVDAIGRCIQAAAPRLPRTFGSRREDGGQGSLRLVGASPIPAVVRVAISGFLALLTGIVTLVLIIACTNVGGVLLAERQFAGGKLPCGSQREPDARGSSGSF
jgi:putative ABC transport system permease protein